MRPVALAAGAALLLGVFHRLELPHALVGFVALVPWLRALDGARTVGRTLALTWVTVVGAVLLSFPWLVTAAGVYGRVPAWLGWVGLVVLAPLLQPQFFVAALVRQHFGGPVPAARVAAACAWLVTEQLVPRLLNDTLGYGLYPLAAYRPVAAVGTVAALTLVVLVVNEVVATLVRRGGRQGWLGAGGVVVAACAVGFVPLGAQGSTGAEVRLAGVQASLPRYDGLLAEVGSEGLMERVLSSHEALSAEAMASAPDLVVWGETVYPTTFGKPKSEGGAEADQRVVRLVQRLQRPLVFGGYDTDGQQEFNAAFLLGPDGEQRDVYRKSRLFPFGEYLPFGELLVKWGLVTGPTGWGRGPGPRAMTVALADGRRLRVQVLICYEAVFGELADVEADLLVVITNDGGFVSALEARQNLVVSAFRSIERGRPQLRVANNGTSAVIDAAGGVVASLPFGARGVLAGTVQLAPGQRPWPVWWLAAGTLAGLVAWRVRRGRG